MLYLFDYALDLFLQSNASKGGGVITYFFAAVGGVILAMVLFFTGVFGKISEKVGERLERSSNAVTRAVGKWLVDKDPETVRPIDSQTKSNPLNSESEGEPKSIYVEQDTISLQEIYSSNFLLSVIHQTPDDPGQRLANSRQAILIARKYMQDQEETPEYLHALDAYPWLGEYVEAQMELRVSYEELVAIQRDKENTGNP